MSDKPVSGSAVSNNGQTHWEGCWRDPGHHACAIAEVERLQAVGQMFDRLRRIHARWAREDFVFGVIIGALGALVVASALARLAG